MDAVNCSMLPNDTYSGSVNGSSWISSSNSSSVCVPSPEVGQVSCGKQEYFSTMYAIIGTSVQGMIFVVGVLGNLLVCYVVSKTKSMHTTTNCYLVSLAVADTITLLTSVPQEILSYHIIGHKWVWGSIGCTLMIYLQYLGIDASALSLTAFTIERYIAICHPIKSKFICTISRAKKIIIACWLFAMCYCSPWFFLATTNSICVKGIGNITKCSFRLKRDSTEYLVMFFADLMLFYVYPLVLSIVLYSLIAKSLLSKAKNKFPGGRDDLRTQAALKSNQARVQVVKMLACVVFIFATLWVPYRGMLVYNTFNTASANKDLWFLMFAKTCIYMNCAINPILYNAMSDKFRKAFRTFLVCCIGRRRSNLRFTDELTMDRAMLTKPLTPGGVNSYALSSREGLGQFQAMPMSSVMLHHHSSRMAKICVHSPDGASSYDQNRTDLASADILTQLADLSIATHLSSTCKKEGKKPGGKVLPELPDNVDEVIRDHTYNESTAL